MRTNPEVSAISVTFEVNVQSSGSRFSVPIDVIRLFDAADGSLFHFEIEGQSGRAIFEGERPLRSHGEVYGFEVSTPLKAGERVQGHNVSGTARLNGSTNI
jgi:hypothetical protein